MPTSIDGNLSIGYINPNLKNEIVEDSTLILILEVNT